ncbi:MAG: hypothetical protein ABIP34_01020 [Rhodoferax sp.]|uniref:hypothetical protein n=1 Tax=Rhodoferax sp. TaxID=50421 RepID=UPI003266265E
MGGHLAGVFLQHPAPLSPETIDRLARRRAGRKYGWTIHAQAIASVLRDATAKLQLSLRNRPGKHTLSRLYTHRLKAM